MSVKLTLQLSRSLETPVQETPPTGTAQCLGDREMSLTRLHLPATLCGSDHSPWALLVAGHLCLQQEPEEG